jgi:hypothetical protein
MGLAAGDREKEPSVVVVVGRRYTTHLGPISLTIMRYH